VIREIFRAGGNGYLLKDGPDRPTPAKIVLQHLSSVGNYLSGNYDSSPPPGMTNAATRDMLSKLVEAQLVRYTITDRRSDERSYEIPSAMATFIDELIYE
jgi:hypothetical protein